MEPTTAVSIRIPTKMLARIDAQAVAERTSRTALLLRPWSGKEPEPVGADAPRPKPPVRGVTTVAASRRANITQAQAAAAVGEFRASSGLQFGPTRRKPGIGLKDR